MRLAEKLDWKGLRRIKHVEEAKKNKLLTNVLTTKKQTQRKAKYLKDPIIPSVEKKRYERKKYIHIYSRTLLIIKKTHCKKRPLIRAFHFCVVVSCHAHKFLHNLLSRTNLTTTFLSPPTLQMVITKDAASRFRISL
jgi:hypothetical protein